MTANKNFVTNEAPLRLADATSEANAGKALAYQLAAAGIGRLVLAHAGEVRLDDLNRQLLMTHASLGTPRMDIAPQRLRELNPDVQIEAIAENVNDIQIGTVDPIVRRIFVDKGLIAFYRLFVLSDTAIGCGDLKQGIFGGVARRVPFDHTFEPLKGVKSTESEC